MPVPVSGFARLAARRSFPSLEPPQQSHLAIAANATRWRWFLRGAAAAMVVGTANILCGEMAAQTLHPNLAVFQPSVDHDAAGPDDHPLVDRYELHISRIGAARPVMIVDLGKPAPDPDGFIRVNVEDAVNVPALYGSNFEARVAAVGSRGASASGPSNLFAVDGCRVVAPGAVVLPADGGALNVPVRMAGCAGRRALRDAAVDETRGKATADVVRIEAAPNTGKGPLAWTRSVGTQLLFILQPAAR